LKRALVKKKNSKGKKPRSEVALGPSALRDGVEKKKGMD